MHIYNEDFYSEHSSQCARSARKIVPLLMSLFRPASVLDVGCGDGTWLSEFGKHGVTDLKGVDGPYVAESVLKISSQDFRSHDLCDGLDLGRAFDLVITLEVAEHLPESSADTFVKTLVTHGDLIVFSASVPGQFGENHINEQWPDYWVDKFKKHGLDVFDVIRLRIWEDRDISWWYRQNILVFSVKSRASRYPCLLTTDRRESPLPLNLAHPEFLAVFRDRLREDANVALPVKKLLKVIRTKLRGR